MQKIAIIGVKENQGYEILNILAENSFNPQDILAVDPLAPLGTTVSFGEDDELGVSPLDSFDFNKADITIFCTTKEQTTKYLNKALSSQTKIVDLSGASFSNSSVLSIIPSINDDQITKDTQIISIPSS